ncbi:MAG: response regulator transcription factor [Planctomycetes bacterium]|nr:response regulator transcription factor [Planctomycetota bacterium]MBI3833914.1 response regulator transcription factor [Planctomycetota bacterium]
MRLLIIDDDRELCELLADYLGSAGFEVEATRQAEDGVRRALSGRYEMAILDVMLPEMDGFEVLRRIRAHSDLPILMLTARGEDIDRIVGLEVGADDYLPKPFNPRELVARLRAVLRRTPTGRGQRAAPDERAAICVGDVELDPSARFVRCGQREIALTATEFALLEKLLRVAGAVVSRDDLSKSVLGRSCAPYDRSIDVHVSNLRRKLGAGRGGGERIQSIRGAGYVYVMPREPGA